MHNDYHKHDRSMKCIDKYICIPYFYNLWIYYNLWMENKIKFTQLIQYATK